MRQKALIRTLLAMLLLSCCLEAESVVVLSIKGHATFTRQGWRTPQTAMPGCILSSTDLFSLDPNAEALILCPDLETIWWPPAGKKRGAAFGCRTGTQKRLLIRDGQRVLSPRAPADPGPIIEPRLSIRTMAPLLRWHPMQQAVQYEIRIVKSSDSNQPVWGPVLVEGFQIKYPTSHTVHQLEPLTEYEVQIRPHGAKSYTAAGVPFRVLTPQDKDALDLSLNRIEASIREKPPRLLASAIRLAAEDVYGEALALIDQANATVNNSAITLLGAYYAERLRFSSEAKHRYSEAYRQAGNEKSTIGQALALEGLARLEPDHSAAKMRLKAASELWMSIADKDAIQRIGDALKGLP
jgi:hypothetical protein